MAQPKLNKILAQVAIDIGDSDEEHYTAADKLGYINKARGMVYSEILHALKEDTFLSLYPDFLVYGDTVTIHPVKDPAIRKMLKMYASNLEYTPVPADMVLEALYNPYSTWYGTASKPRFSEQGTAIIMIGVAQASTISKALYLAQPVDVVIDPNTADIIEPDTWVQMIISKAVELMKTSQQTNQ